MRFFGLINWCAKFIPNFSTISEPLNNLKRKDIPYVWSEECQQSFRDIKNSIAHAVELSLPDFNHGFEVHCDASNVGIGAVLTQIIQGDHRIIAFMSKTLNKAQRNFQYLREKYWHSVKLLSTGASIWKVHLNVIIQCLREKYWHSVKL